jgi:hypothetical protein
LTKRQPGLLFISIRRWYKMYKGKEKKKRKKPQRGGNEHEREKKEINTSRSN